MLNRLGSLDTDKKVDLMGPWKIIVAEVADHPSLALPIKFPPFTKYCRIKVELYVLRQESK